MGLKNPSIRHASYTFPSVRIGDGKRQRQSKDLNKPYVIKTYSQVGKATVTLFCEAACISLAKKAGRPLANIKTELVLGQSVKYLYEGVPYIARLELQS